MNTAAMVSVAIAAVAAIIAATRLRHVAPTRQVQPAEEAKETTPA